MTTNNVDWTPEIENYILKAQSMLKTAQLTLDAEDYMSSINRSYYAALDAARTFVAQVEQFLASPPAEPLVRELREEHVSSSRPRDLSGLLPNERAAVQSFVAGLHAQIGERIARMVLFGSKARGDSGSDSDIDILVVVDAIDRRFEAQVSGIASELDLKYDVLLNTHLLTRERWEDYTRRRAALWLNVQRDGIELDI